MHEGFVDTAVARLHYSRTGDGPPLLLIPGSGGWRFNFEAIIPVLAERHAVYALDPPGQGLTKIVDNTFPSGVDAIARSIGNFLDAVGLSRAAIVGHSWGGGFALRFAELYPDRVSRLALIAPGGLDIKDVLEFRLVRIRLVGEVATFLTFAASVRHMLRKSFAHGERIPYDRVDDLLRPMRSPRKRLATLRDMLRVERSVRWVNTERDLRLVRAPTLILWGNQDRYFPVDLIERFTARLPTVETHIVVGGGHSLHDDCPDETYALLAPFLAKAP